MATDIGRNFHHLQNGFKDDRWEEVEVPVPWGIVTAKWWGPRDKQPVLAIHGWQDNCGTFDRLCPLLPKEIPIFCIDLPGHGKSSHYPVGMQYYLFWDGISLIRRIVKHFEWTNIILLGHSLGGALSFMYASCFPDDVSKFISIDIAGPPVRDLKQNASITGICIDKFLEYENLPESKMPCYEYDDMVKLVVQAYEGSVDRESAKILMRRGMAPAPKHLNKSGYHFARDLRLKISTQALFSLEQVLAYAAQIKCKVLNIRANPGRSIENPSAYPLVIETMKQNAKLVIYKEVPGTHHVHLVDPERVAGVIKQFLEM